MVSIFILWLTVCAVHAFFRLFLIVKEKKMLPKLKHSRAIKQINLVIATKIFKFFLLSLASRESG